MRKTLLSVLKAVAALPVAMLLATALPASAATITYLQTGHGTGTLDGVAFDSDFAITAIADTANVSSCGVGCLTNDNLSATIYIGTVGMFNFVTPTRYFSNGTTSGFSRAGVAGADLFNMGSFPLWDMVSSVGPVMGTANLLQWTSGDVQTTGGVLIFDEATTPSSFTATVVSEVPVPAAVWLFGSGLVGLAGVRRKS